MSRIRAKNTGPELMARAALRRAGSIGYRLHYKKVPGRPDIAFVGRRVAVFVHGCFWHRHKGCRYATVPATRPEFWRAKFDANVARDRTVRTTLLDGGWRVATVWECALRKPDQVAASAELLSTWLLSDEDQIEIGAEV